MARIFITGSSDGLGSLAAKRLVANGHNVVLHARNAQRANDATAACPGAETVVIGDLSTMAGAKKLAEEVNRLGQFDTVIHNAGLFLGPFRKTEDGMPALAAVNTIAPYILTSLIRKPKRLVYVSSGLHTRGNGDLEDITWQKRGEQNWNDMQAYSDSKLHDIMFAKAFARRWPDVQSNALDPGWVPTKMGGAGASGSLEKAVDTYVMLAEGDDAGGKRTGKYFLPNRKETSPKSDTDDEKKQDQLLEICARVSRVDMPN